VRDWSDEGKEERAECYGKLLTRLEEIYPDREERKKTRVLVPGSGLCRLNFECCHLGFETQGNEFSVHMLLASYVILNLVTEPYSLSLHPYLHQSCNLIGTGDQFREVKVPDLIPNHTLAPGSKFSMVAGEFAECYGKQEAEWDVFCSCFFLDTAHNIFDYLRLIKQILKPGGYLINIGPLLWHYADQAHEESVEVSWEELRSIMVQMGFEFLHEEFIDAHYTSNNKSMMRMRYNAIHFVARKKEEA